MTRWKDQVHVFADKLQVLNRGASKAEELLTTGRARSANPDGSWQKIPLDPDAFLSELPMVYSASVQVVSSRLVLKSPHRKGRVRGLGIVPLRGSWFEGSGNSIWKTVYGLVRRPAQLRVSFKTVGHSPELAVAVFAPSP